MAARLAAYWLLFQGVLGLGDGGSSSFRRFGVAIAVNSTLLALFSLVQFLTWNGKIYWIVPGGDGHGGPFACHSHLAAYLNLGLGFALASLLASDRQGGRSWLRGSRPWAALAVALIVVAIVASLSRSGFVAMLAAAAVLLVLRRARWLSIVGGIAAVIALVASMLLTLGDSSPYIARLNTLLTLSQTLAESRWEIWRESLRTWWDHPIWGTGLGTFAEATAPYFRHDDGAFASRAENEYLDMLVEGGIIGLALALAGQAGIIGLGYRALKHAPSSRRRASILGAFFGLTSLAVHSLSDFALHLPGVAVPAVILAAHLCRLGLQGRNDRPPGRVTLGKRAGSVGVGLAMVLLAGVLVVYRNAAAHIEVVLLSSGLPFPGTMKPTAYDELLPREVLERHRTALEHVLRHRPDLAEVHLRLGMTYLGLYQWAAAELIGDAVKDPVEKAVLTDPLWMLGVVHSGKPQTAAQLLEHEPIRLYLVPAARHFLEARRCCPVLTLAHAGLASVHYLLEGGDTASAYAERALRLAGSDSKIITFTGRIAVLAGDVDLAVRCWRRSLEVHPEGWEQVADAAALGLPPEVILDRIVPSGRHALLFANRLYADPKDRAVRERFLKAAITRLPEDPNLTAADRYHLEAQAWAELDGRSQAEDSMTMALGLEPRQAEWRKEFVDWLLKWGKVTEAHEQALIGVSLTPGHPGATQAYELAGSALAHGTRASHPERETP